MDPALEKMIDDLSTAVGLLDREKVTALCEDLVAHVRHSDEPIPQRVVTGVLTTLRRKRFFNQMQFVADALVQAQQDYPAVRRKYAQALIDQGALTAARAVLSGLIVDTRDDAAEHAEARGLLGRALKQIYVDAQRPRPVDSAAHRTRSKRYSAAMQSAIRYYYEAFAENRAANYWHGINAVACEARARRDGIWDETLFNPSEVAAEILKRVDARGDKASVWELGTAIEACVALGERRAAAGWALDYVRDETRSDGSYADAFEISSTMRQLTEVWELEAIYDPGKTILPILAGGLLRRQNGCVSVRPEEVRRLVDTVRTIREEVSETERVLRLEKVFGADAFMSLDTYEAGLKRNRTVARIGLEGGGRGAGTGFLVRGRDLSDRYGDQWLLLTNAHVISAKGENDPAVTPEDAVITFEALSRSVSGGVQTYGVGSILWESSPQELDTTVIALDRPVDGLIADDCCEFAKALPVNNQKGRVYIIGHPSGGALSYSIQDNILIDYEDPRLHYRAPTEGGSSGSPIYNAQWKLIGLHHAGSHEMPRLRNQVGSYQANEGIWIQAIRRALASV